MKTLLIIVFLFTYHLHAKQPICKEDGNQMQMNECAYQDFLKEDKALNRIYQSLKRKYKSNQTYLNNLKASQRLWIKFRDSELKLIYSCEDKNIRMCFGSMYPLLYNGDKAEMTKARRLILRGYLEKRMF